MTRAQARDVVLRRVRLVGADREPVDVVIRVGRLAAIMPTGTSYDPDMEVVDLEGRFVMSGLWDHHVHLGLYAVHGRRLDLARARSARDAATIVAEHLGRDRPAGLVVGVDFRDALWPDVPSLELLDAAAPDRPVVLINNDLHCGWLNSIAFHQFFGAVPSDPVLRESDLRPVFDRIEALAEQQRPELLRAAVAAAARRGVVGVVELERAANLRLWSERVAAGIDQLRVECCVYEEHLDDALALGLVTGAPAPDGLGLVTMGRLKLVVDGSLGTRTAYCHDPYLELVGSGREYGVVVTGPERLTELVGRAHRAGIESTIHAIGDHANTLALDAFEQVGTRGRIEHAQLVRREDVARFGRLGVTASVQPRHAVDDRDIADHHWAGRTSYAYPYANLVAAHVPLLLGSDAPVAPLDPWCTIAAAVHRSDDGRPPWHPEQHLDRLTALDASTSSGATPRVGAAADLVVLDADPLTAPLDQLRVMPVHATLLAGRCTWQS